MIESKRRKPVVPQRLAESEDEVQAMVRDWEERAEILRGNHAELIAKYPDQWVAIGDNWQFVAAATHVGVTDKLKECGAFLPHSVIKRLETNPKRRIPTAWRRRA